MTVILKNRIPYLSSSSFAYPTFIVTLYALNRCAAAHHTLAFAIYSELLPEPEKFNERSHRE